MVWMMNFQDDEIDTVDQEKPDYCAKCGTPIDNDFGLCLDCQQETEQSIEPVSSMTVIEI